VEALILNKLNKNCIRLVSLHWCTKFICTAIWRQGHVYSGLCVAYGFHNQLWTA
jgi:hypothetical protein